MSSGKTIGEQVGDAANYMVEGTKSNAQAVKDAVTGSNTSAETQGKDVGRQAEEGMNAATTKMSHEANKATDQNALDKAGTALEHATDKASDNLTKAENTMKTETDKAKDQTS